MIISTYNEYNDTDIYDSIINEYNIDITNIDLIKDIYLCKKEINKSKCNIKKNINNINKLKSDFFKTVSDWKLEDSCNKNKLKLHVLNIKKTHEIISHLQYLNEDLNNIIDSYIIKIKGLLKNKENTQTIQIENSEIINELTNSNIQMNSENIDDNETEDYLNSIINY